MKAKIEVADRKEAQQIRRGLADPEVRALVKIMGVMLPLPDGAKRRSLRWARDWVNEQVQLEK